MTVEQGTLRLQDPDLCIGSATSQPGIQRPVLCLVPGGIWQFDMAVGVV